MFSVAICDDEKVICKQIELYLETHIMDNRISTEIFYSGEQLYEAIEKGKQFDLIFLDIELTMLSGIAVGMKIREELCNEATHLVFISGKSEYAMDLFPLRPLHFLVKPFSREQVIGTLEKAMSLSVIYNQYFEFQIDHILHRINYQNILFLKAMQGKLYCIQTAKNTSFMGS